MIDIYLGALLRFHDTGKCLVNYMKKARIFFPQDFIGRKKNKKKPELFSAASMC